MSDAGRRAVQLQQLATALPRLFGELDEAMIEEIEAQVDWIDLHGGSYLFRQGDAGESVYILVSGRLQVVAATDEGGELVLGEIGPGESVGEIALLTGERRTASIRAIRDSVLVEIGHQAFMATVERHPQVAMNLATQVIHQLRDRTSGKKPEPAGAFNIALVSVGDEDLAGELGEAVAAEMQRYGATLRLDSEGLEAASSIAGAATAGKGSLEHTRLTAWLDGCERDHRWVLYQADPAATPWTRRCLRQADLILLVGLAGSESAPGMIETAFLRGDQRLSRAESRLVLLHEGNTDGIEGTAAWLEPRKVERHYHLRRGDSADHARLARYLTGNAVALVLGGGAARGLAHVGIFRALEELGVPVDAVGGSSIGAAIAGGIALGWEAERLHRTAREAFYEQNPLDDFTLPMVSILRGRKLEKMVESYFPGYIEDLPLPFFCVSSNLSSADLITYDRGLLWQAVRASVALPGVLPPAVSGNSLLIDGGILNNLPVDIMRQRFEGQVIAVDLHVRKEYDLQYASVPSPWRVMLSKLPFTKRLRVPGITTIMMKATEMGSIVHAQQNKAGADLYLNPPVGRFGILDMKAFDKIAEVGYQYTLEEAATWAKARRPNQSVDDDRII
jgi:predicted acylesterase/phospholipase RssA/CRP-like cAMP-binding protein